MNLLRLYAIPEQNPNLTKLSATTLLGFLRLLRTGMRMDDAPAPEHVVHHSTKF